MSMRNIGGFIGNPNASLTPPTTLEYLVVAGGASGITSTGQVYPHGGGGAGGFLTATGYAITAGSSISITVGAGGVTYAAGNNSVFGNITAIAGGGAASGPGGKGGNGGSGGGQDDVSPAGLGTYCPPICSSNYYA